MAETPVRELVASLVIQFLSKERERKGLSMAVLAHRSGLSQATISLIERELRNPTLDTLLRISEVLEVELGEVILRASQAVTPIRPSPTTRKVKIRTHPAEKSCN